MVLGFWEIEEKEQPPPEMWGNDEKLTQWFKDVQVIREANRPGGKPDLEEVPLMQNESLELPALW